MTSGTISRPTHLLADGVSQAADNYTAYALEVAGFDWALVRVVCDKSHDTFVQAIATPGGDAADLYDGVTKLAVLAVAGSSTGHAHLVRVTALFQLQVLIHNADQVDAATVTVEVTLS